MLLRSSLIALLALACAGDDASPPGPAETATPPGNDTGTADTSADTSDTATDTGLPGSVAATGRWTWASPLPNGGTLRRMQFTSDANAYAMTDGGGILRTTDGGDSWVDRYGIQELGFAGHFAMSFVDDETGWLVGNRGRIVHTADGGATWTDQSPPDFTFDLFDVQFTNPLHGVAVGATGRVLTTDDGGATWTERSHPGGSAFFRGVAFVDDLRGWAAGDDAVVIETTDGGATWERLFPTFDDDIDRAVPAGTGLAVGTRNEIYVYNGLSWIRRLDADSLSEMHFDSLDEGTALYSKEGELRLGRFAGGQLATEQVLTVEPSPLTFAQRGDHVLLGGRNGSVFSSTDGGATFQDRTTRLALPLDAQFLDVALAGDRGVAVGFDGVAVISADGGVTWTPTPTGTTTDLRSVTLDAQGRAIAAGYEATRQGFVPSIVWSTDSGATWTDATGLPATESFLEGVALWDDGRAIAVGGTPTGGEVILLSEDGGQSWTATLGAGDTAGFVDVFTVGTQHAWLGAGFGDVVRTVDGGSTFATIDSGSNRAFQGIHFIDEMTGWAVTQSQDVLTTIDGGLNWDVVTVPATSFSDVAFGSAQVGIAVSTSGAYGTIDGGQTWTQQATGWSGFENLRAIRMTSETDGVMVGTGVGISYTRNAGGAVIAP